MTPEQHLAEAERWLESAKKHIGGKYELSAACAGIATAHAAIAAAKKQETKR